jgi:hypothetical protein
LSIWKEKSVEEQLDDPHVNNVGIYKTIADEMAEKGYDKSSDQCKVRMHTLKRIYRSCKGNMKKSGKGRRTYKLYEELDAILGCRPASSPLKVVESMSKRKTLASDTYSSSDSEDIDAEPPSDREIEPLTEEADESDSENRDDQNEPTETLNIENQENQGQKATPLNEKDKKDKPKSRKLEQKPQTSTDKKTKKVKKSKLEVALGTVMEGFGTASDKSEDKFIDLEKSKIQLKKDKLELEKEKLESSERQQREERRHQYDMMKMIMDAMGNRSVQQPAPGPSSSSMTMHPGTQQSRSMDQWSTDVDSSFNDSGSRTYYTM